MAIFIVLVVLLAVGYRVMTPDQRVNLVQSVWAAIQRGRKTAVERRLAHAPFQDALRSRMRWVIVTPALVALNVAVFVWMLVRDGVPHTPSAVIAWGGNFGPLTTNGEWWRLVTMMFVHSGWLHLAVEAAALIQLGFLLERLVGRWTLGIVYTASGLFAGLVSVSGHPVAVTDGASGAIFGLLGLLLASVIWSRIRPSTVSIPLTAAHGIVPYAAVFLLYTLATDHLGIAAGFAGLGVGFAGGLVLARGFNEGKPPARRLVVVAATMVLTAAASALPLRGITDVRPEIARLLALEDRTAAAYGADADRLTSGRITAEALAQSIERTIMPELREADVRLKALRHVPPEHQALVAHAEEYVRLRYESWRLRADGLRRTDALARGDTQIAPVSDTSPRRQMEAQYRAHLRTLGKAEGAERASLEALDKIRN